MGMTGQPYTWSAVSTRWPDCPCFVTGSQFTGNPKRFALSRVLGCAAEVELSSRAGSPAAAGRWLKPTGIPAPDK